MLDFNFIFEFSRNNCLIICTFLIPACLLTTIQTLLFLAFNRPPVQIRRAAIFASILAIALLFHVFTWFSIGVVTIVTFILSGLGSSCLVINLLAFKYPNLRQHLARMKENWS